MIREMPAGWINRDDPISDSSGPNSAVRVDNWFENAKRFPLGGRFLYNLAENFA